ncbi:MAG: hypothetical protein WDO69_31450 [Pseudomonadota bacterium]
MSQMHLFFDLDGTLTDSRAGILISLRHALTAVGVEVPPTKRSRDSSDHPFMRPFASY